LYPGLTPRARAYGSLPAAEATINRVVNVLTFDPGTGLPGLSPLPSSLGYIVTVVFQDPTAPAATSVITDSCTLFRVTRFDQGLTDDNGATTSVNESGFVYRSNPAANGTYTFYDYAQSLRDFDSDGIENQLDSCPTTSTPSWNPRISDAINDPDNDGIPGQDDPAQGGEQLLAGTGCDSTPTTSNTDADGDGFSNRQDSCATTANGTQADADRDGMGDACDVLDNLGDGHLHEVCVNDAVAIGSGGPPTGSCSLEFVPDHDNDGFSQSVEAHVTTNSGDPCGQNAWPADLFSSGLSFNDVDIQDLSSFVAPPPRKLNTDPLDPGYDVRWDLVPFSTLGKDINIQDMAAITILYPPMLEGARAYGGPACPYAP
ncbi:MAG: thrombospondin type 3 repeat-containing protein, partial [Gammaproteobacteria bacterium]